MKQFVIGYLTGLINSYEKVGANRVVEDLKAFLVAVEDYPDPELVDLFGEEELKDITEHLALAAKAKENYINGMAEVCL